MTNPRRNITPVTGPSTEPVTLDELKAFARVDQDDEDGLLDSLITAARMAAENYTRRAFITQSWKLSLDLPCSGWADRLPAGTYDLPVSALFGELPTVIELPRAPLQSITSVTTYDADNTATTFSASNYTADLAGNRLVLSRDAAWPSGMRQFAAVEILTVSGYGDSGTDVPMPIRQAILMHATSLYETRGQCGYDTPPGCQQLLRQYKIERL